ncbi:MAG TPA: SPW repeat protein [Candidatus Udaeobacter sp.]|nr:SPW repeat protein [Candidatus Udaeobacter sp.]
MYERQVTRAYGNEEGISWINILLAIWLIISPFVLTFSIFPRAMWNNVITGIVIGIIAMLRTSMPQHPSWSWSNVILGIWLIISPFVLGFFSQAALWNNVILGIIIGLVSWGNAMTKAHAAI